MTKELVIGSNRHETKVAILEDDQLVEVYFQRANEYSLAGSIHKGRVTRVLPGMQSAFVDLGLERDTFLYVSDFFEEHDDIDIAEEKPARGERRERDRGQGRGGEQRFSGRAPEERSAEVREIRPAGAEPEAAESDQGEREAGVSATEVQGAVAPAGIENRPQEQRNEDRGFRNEGRNRRGRRRRQRGRGFPENKYAQPVTAAAATPEAAAGESDKEEEGGEVIILPGESLAKYRQRPGGAEGSGLEEAAGTAPEFSASATEEPAGQPDTTPEEQEAIEEEAEE